MPEYPPEPWRMAGEACLSAWRVPASRVPAVPEGLDPVVVAGQTLVLTAWVRYLEPSPLTYNELLAAVAVRDGRRVAGSITEIWVDSAASRAGGRELWGIPKDIAAFHLAPGRSFTATAAACETWVATAAYKIRGGLPFAPPSRATIVQTFGDTLKHSAVRVRGKPRLTTASWNVNPDGPLGYLAGRAPFLSMQLHDFDMSFGNRS